MSEKETKEMIVAYETSIEDINIELNNAGFFQFRYQNQLLDQKEYFEEQVEQLYKSLGVPKEKQGLM